MATRQTAGTRAKDTDRNNTCQVLDSALSDGQLSMDEHRTRVAAATTAACLRGSALGVASLLALMAGALAFALAALITRVRGGNAWSRRA